MAERGAGPPAAPSPALRAAVRLRCGSGRGAKARRRGSARPRAATPGVGAEPHLPAAAAGEPAATAPLRGGCADRRAGRAGRRADGALGARGRAAPSAARRETARRGAPGSRYSWEPAAARREGKGLEQQQTPLHYRRGESRAARTVTAPTTDLGSRGEEAQQDRQQMPSAQSSPAPRLQPGQEVIVKNTKLNIATTKGKSQRKNQLPAARSQHADASYKTSLQGSCDRQGHIVQQTDPEPLSLHPGNPHGKKF
ncbi:uncharacterized protein LOC116227855 [Phasianus colchicus]|uniref:uncharacterized protein LOC116227855 n=1 Tax=Phasianus colchicus TaxID=9054 RepID=UPI00129EE158|nr:uncharacterized protein LOC116227855 [Phasianus colchicus]